MMKNRRQLGSPRHSGVGMIIGITALALLAFPGLQARISTSADGSQTFEDELKTCMNAGDGMGKAMVGLLKGETK